MKEFIEKLIGRLEKIYNRNDKAKKEAYEEQDWERFDLFTHRNDGVYTSISIVNELAEEYRNDKVFQTAIMYAENLHKYGVQIDSIWETATQQSMALNQAYMRGRQDERDIFDQWQEKHINTSTDTSTDTSSGWIPCSERLPEIEAEIRAKAIDEFAEVIRGIHYNYPIGTDADTNEPLYAHEDGTWHNLLNDVAEQLKGGAV